LSILKGRVFFTKVDTVRGIHYIKAIFFNIAVVINFLHEIQIL
jgi:hypothetical protein